jgi:hypothetical protein
MAHPPEPAASDQLDGRAWNTPSIDAITEFSVDTNGFKAESGRAQVDCLPSVSKSGTNEYHGTAYEFGRNNVFDARNYFETKTSVLKQHDFGGTIGGPVRIPWIYNGTNKTFFFRFGRVVSQSRWGQQLCDLGSNTRRCTRVIFRRWVNPSGKLS